MYILFGSDVKCYDILKDVHFRVMVHTYVVRVDVIDRRSTSNFKEPLHSVKTIMKLL